MQRRHAISSLLALGALPYLPTARANAAPKRAVVVLLRGAVDGLSVVAPYAEAGYRDERPTIALAAPGQAGGAIDLDGRCGLHPALASLQPLWAAGQLSFVHACGAQTAGRSHFEAQDELEAGTPGKKTTPDGWMGRLLALSTPDAADASSASQTVRAVYGGSTRPRILVGDHAVAALPGGNAGRPARRVARGTGGGGDLGSGLQALYANDPRYGQAWADGQSGRAQMSEALAKADAASSAMQMGGSPGTLEREMQAASNGAPLPDGFPDDARRLARVMRGDARVQFALMQLGGWDTHARQGAAQGQLASHLAPLGQGLAVLARELGPLWNDTVVLVVSEFGRTVRENGNGGTDHGHGNAVWVMGGGLARSAGGRVLGPWPGLERSARFEGRDLAITTDYRAVFGAMVAQHLRFSDAQLAGVFPGYGGGVMGLFG
jgi:uncharacterized protein (DUF1501 family)